MVGLDGSRFSARGRRIAHVPVRWRPTPGGFAAHLMTSITPIVEGTSHHFLLIDDRIQILLRFQLDTFALFIIDGQIDWETTFTKPLLFFVESRQVLLDLSASIERFSLGPNLVKASHGGNWFLGVMVGSDQLR